MVLNFGLAAGVLYATRKSKLPFKERLKKLHSQALTKRDLTIWNVPSFKITLVLIHILIQVWLHNTIQRHKMQLHTRLVMDSAMPLVRENVGRIPIHPSSIQSILRIQILAHTVLIVVCLIQLLLLRVDTLKVSNDQVLISSYGLVRVSRKIIFLESLKQIRVLRKGVDKFSHKTRKFSLRIFWDCDKKTHYQDFYQTISLKIVKQKCVEILGCLKMPYDEAKVDSVINDC